MKLWARQLALGLLLTAAIPPAAAYAADSAEQILLDKANYWRLKDRPDLARDALDKLLSVNPMQPDALYAYGVVELQQGNVANARGYLARLRQVAPTDPRGASLADAIAAGRIDTADLGQARKLGETGDFNGAVKKYQQAFNGPAPATYGVEYYTTLAATPTGHDAALKGLRQLAKNAPSDPAIALALAKVETYAPETRSDGIAALARLSTDPAVGADALRAWHEALLWLGGTKQDRDAYHQYLAKYPQDTEVRQHLEDAPPDVEVADKGPSIDYDAYIALQQGKLADAETQFSAALKLHASDADALAGLGMVRLRQSRFVEARDLLGRAIKGEPARKSEWQTAYGSAALWAGVQDAKAQMAKGDNQRARATLTALLAQKPADAWGAELLLGEVAGKLGDKTGAEQAYRRVLAAKPQNEDALVGLATVLTAAGKTAEAAAVTARLSSSDRARLAGGSSPSDALRGAAKEAAAHGDAATAGAKYQEAVAAAPKDPWMRLDYARFLAGQGKAAQGFATIDPAASGNTPTALYAAAVFDDEQHRPADALAKLDRIPEAQRTADMTRLRADIAVPATVERAKMLAAAGKGAEAKALIVAAAQSGAGGTKAAIDYAWALVAAGNETDADAVIAKIDPASGGAELQRLKSTLALRSADALRRKGDAAGASRAYAAAYRLDPHNTDALAEIIDDAIQSGDTAGARRYLGAAMSAHPNNARFYYLEAQLARAEGDNRAALKALETARALNGQRPEAGGADAAGSGGSMPPPQSAGDLNTGAGSSEPPPLEMTATSAGSSDITPSQPAGGPAQLASLGSGAVSDGDLGPDAAATPSNGGKRVQLAQLELDVPGPVPIAAYGAPPPNPNAGNGPAPPQDSLQLDIERSIAAIEAEASPTLEGGLVYRGRFGTAGLGQLNEVGTPVDGTFSPFMTGKMTISVSPLWLDAGPVGSSSLSQFGANQTLNLLGLTMVTPGEQSAFGALGSVAYAYGDFSGKIGESAWGFPVTNLIGNVAYNPKFFGGQMNARIEAFREPVTDTLLSYAGTHANLTTANAVTGGAFGTNGTWGGVTKSGLRGSVFYDDNNIGAFGIVGGGVLQGTNVASNSTVNAIIGGYFRPWRTDNQAVRVGVNLNYFHFDKNLSYYSFGQGGYFSPANYVALTFPVEWEGREDRWSWLAAVGLGIQHSNTDSSPYYPNNPAAQTALELIAGSTSDSNVRYGGGHSTGLGADVRGQIEYAVSKDLAVGASAQYDNGNSYNEGIVKLYFRKTFAEAAPVAPILPGTPSGGPADTSSPPPAAPTETSPPPPVPITPAPITPSPVPPSDKAS